MPKCKYCVEEYRYKKIRKLLDIKNVTMITEGIGYCFGHLKYHNDLSLEKQLQEHLVSGMQREVETQRVNAMISPQLIGASLGALRGPYF